jgi:hypothetical protein
MVLLLVAYEPNATVSSAGLLSNEVPYVQIDLDVNYKTRDHSHRNRKIPNRLFESHFAKDMDSAV